MAKYRIKLQKTVRYEGILVIGAATPGAAEELAKEMADDDQIEWEESEGQDGSEVIDWEETI